MAPLTVPLSAPARDAFLALVDDARETHLADNVDYLFSPWGVELPDPAGEDERIERQLEVLDRCGTFWDALGDEESRQLFLRFLAYRALGPAHVRLQLEPGDYRRQVIALTAGMLRQAGLLGAPGMPFEWQFHHYDLHATGCPVQILGQPLPIASTFLFSQYAYRDPAVPARPRLGDTAIDAGGCWGETALWLAHSVGSGGTVHSFEPTPRNRDLLHKNLSLNPSLQLRVKVWDAPLAAEAGERVWIRNTIAAGATMQDHSVDDSVELTTDTIDAMVARGEIDAVDFIKVDVEGADLGVLQGAADTIRSQRPRLAIACYHKPDDLAVIPDFVASLGVEYDWYLQCSTMTDIDTVAFAVPASR